jgi:hypothetical protein
VSTDKVFSKAATLAEKSTVYDWDRMSKTFGLEKQKLVEFLQRADA